MGHFLQGARGDVGKGWVELRVCIEEMMEDLMQEAMEDVYEGDRKRLGSFECLQEVETFVSTVAL